jgi:hypothetical protein
MSRYGANLGKPYVKKEEPTPEVVKVEVPEKKETKKKENPNAK